MPFTTHTLLDRFLRYVRIDTQADEKSTTYPSSPGPTRARQDAPRRTARDGPRRTPAERARPRLRHRARERARRPDHRVQRPRRYHPRELAARTSTRRSSATTPAATSCCRRTRRRSSASRENPELNALVGKTIITTDGTTLLGADDKAGVAVIMEAARILTENPDIPHGPVRVVFTCDEEIGKGVLHLDPKRDRGGGRVHARRRRRRRDRGRDVLRRQGDGHDHRREHPPVASARGGW